MPSYPRPCPKCGVLTEEEGFGIDPSKTSGRRSYCKKEFLCSIGVPDLSPEEITEEPTAR